MAFTPVIGYIYDIFGRRKTLFVSIIMAATLLMLVPLAPSIYPWLPMIRAGVSVCLIAPVANPFINDYVKKKSRG